MTKPHRLTISLCPESYAVIEDLSEASGMSKSALLDQFILQAAPTFRGLSKAFRQAQEDQADTFDTLTEILHEAQSRGAQAGLQLNTERREYRRRKKTTNK